MSVSKKSITELQNYLKDMPQIECPIVNRFAPGCYIREMTMPKGSLVIGKVHLTEHFNIILKGRVTVATIEGVETYNAPHTFISGKNIQKVIYMHEDCVWQTVHPTDKTCPDEIEKEIIAESYDSLESVELAKKIEVSL